MLLKIYKSSAGSGKTFTLVKEYLKLSLPYPDRFKYIAALTFTNASAAEMKDRILKALKELVTGANPNLKDLLLEEGITPRQIANAPILLEKILFHYSDFNIGTIDSFFHRIIRSFNKELNIPYDFEINIDETEAIDYAVDRFLQKSSEQPEIHKILIAYIREKISNSQSWSIGADLSRIAREVLKDHSLLLGETDIPQIMDFIAELKTIMNEFEAEMDQKASQLINGVHELGLEIEDFKYGKAGALSFILKSLKANRDYDPNSRFLAGLTDDFEWYKKNDPNMRLIEEALDTFLRSGCLELFETFEHGNPDYATAREILKNIYTFSVYEEINKMFDEYRAEKNVLLVSDFTRILSTHIKNEEVSYIYSKIGSRLDHFLIDEFQDTSSLQWSGIKPLVENAVSQGNMCLVVGDSKQAIYRWRGGTVSLIERQLSENDFPGFSEKLSLNQNYRSGQAIVDFNNLFFVNVPSLFAGETDEYLLLNDIFKESSQQYHNDFASSGYVEVNFIPRPGRTRESFLDLAKEKLLSQIAQVLQDGFAYKDITILVRDRRDATETANLLHSESIPFISYDSLQLKHSPTVRLLLSLMTWLNNPDDVLARTEAMFLYQEYIKQNSPSASGILDTIVQSDPEVWPDAFSGNIEKLSALPLYEMVAELCIALHLNTADAYLQRFQDAVLEYMIDENGSYAGFMDWWEKGNFTVVLPANQDAVQIMTIHKSKGLEFPVVLIPFADWDFNGGRPNMIWVTPSIEPFNTFPVLPINFGTGLKGTIFEDDYIKEEAYTAIDNLNLLYVALTRAKMRLYVNTQSVKNAPANGIKSIPQLISQVLKPALVAGEAQNTYGEAMRQCDDEQMR